MSDLPSPSERLVTCPSGLQGYVRPLKIKEANALVIDNPRQRIEALDRILAACWVRTTDPGPYKLAKEDGPVPWMQAVIADRFVAFVYLRIATYGSGYEFQVRCGGCRGSFGWEIDLVRDLPIKPLPPAAIEAIANGNRLTVHLGGQRVVHRLLTGADERKAQKVDGEKVLTTALATRVVEVEGVHANDRIRWIEDLKLGLAMDLLAAMDENDGGIETKLGVECVRCGEAQEVEVPFGREFWLRVRPKSSGARPET